MPFVEANADMWNERTEKRTKVVNKQHAAKRRRAKNMSLICN
jgi:hypothetical protein